MLGDYSNYRLSSNSWKKVSIALLIGLGVVAAVATVLAVPKSNSPPAISQLQLEEEEFKNFMITYNKQYSTEQEKQDRFQIFRENLAFINAHNSRDKNWKLGVNQFTDMTDEEFQRIYIPGEIEIGPAEEVETFEGVESPPGRVDWRKRGAVTDVKNQGHCGSCWAFSTTGSIEGAWEIVHHNLVSLSEQELIDCSWSYGNHGCHGGLMPDAFKFVEKNGITSEKNYPYQGRDQRCDKNAEDQVVARIASYTRVKQDDTEALRKAVAQQPISVAVDAKSWKQYSGGVLDDDCGTNLDHGVLIVGYDWIGDTKYWIVKNSWGKTWGEHGYIRIGVKDGEGVCGINKTPSYQVVKY